MSKATKTVFTIAASLSAGLGGSPALSAEGWALSVIEICTIEMLGCAGLTGGANINDRGQIAFLRDDVTGYQADTGLPIYRQTIVVSDGTSRQVIYDRTDVLQSNQLVANRISINNEGRVVLAGGIRGQGTDLFEVVDNDLRPILPQPPRAAVSSGHMNSRGEVAWQQVSAGNTSSVDLTISNGVQSQSHTVPYYPLFSPVYLPAAVNAASEAVGLSLNTHQDYNSGDVARLAVVAPFRQGYVELGQSVRASFQHGGDLGFNDRGVVAYSRGLNQTNAANGIFVVDIREGTPAPRLIVSQGTPGIGRTGGGTSINNSNLLLFSTWPESGTPGLHVYGVDGQYLSTVARAEQTLPTGQRIGLGTSNTWPVFSRSLSNAGPVAFVGTLDGVSAAILRADPVPGLLPHLPLLPGPGDELEGGGWRFERPDAVRVCRRVSTLNDCDFEPIVFIDPPVAVGYRYQILGDAPGFSGVQVPTPLPRGDAEFVVEFGELSETLRAGEWFDFLERVPGGVQEFTIRGIDPEEGLDPENGAAFVTGLKLAGSVAPDAVYEIRMIPIRDAEPDVTPPVIAPSISGTQFNPPWYISDVQLSWSVSDPESDVTSTSGCGAVSLTTDTAGTTYTCSATSAGGTTTESITLRRDATSPVITFGTPSPAANVSGWNRTDVSVPFTATDATSGVATLAPPASPIVITGEGASLSGSVTATDQAGLENTASTPIFKIDRTDPSISIAMPAPGAVYVQNQAVTASYACTDGLSGIADGGCSGPVPSGSPVPTGSIGSFDFTVLARDRADNAIDRTHRYTVVEIEPMACDADVDGDIDKLDLSLITAARNQPASGPADPRDADRDGVITQKDVNLCRSRCDQKGCK